MNVFAAQLQTANMPLDQRESRPCCAIAFELFRNWFSVFDPASRHTGTGVLWGLRHFRELSAPGDLGVFRMFSVPGGVRRFFRFSVPGGLRRFSVSRMRVSRVPGARCLVFPKNLEE